MSVKLNLGCMKACVVGYRANIQPLNKLVLASVIITFAAGFFNSFEDDVMEEPSMMKAGKKVSTTMDMLDPRSVTFPPMGIV